MFNERITVITKKMEKPEVDSKIDHLERCYQKSGSKINPEKLIRIALAGGGVVIGLAIVVPLIVIMLPLTLLVFAIDATRSSGITAKDKD